jgi:hypothetical protein
MSEAKQRKAPIMGPKGFLYRTNTGKHSADGFIAQHRVWLETGELSLLVSPILRKLDAKEILPTPALTEIQNVVLGHIMAEEIRKGEEAMARRESEGGTVLSWVATIYNSKDEIQTRVSSQGKVEELHQGFNLGQEADRWVDRRLVEGESDWYGIVAHTSITIQGTPLSSVISRKDAIARIFKRPLHPFMKETKNAGKLSFGVKSKPFVAHFSKG